MAILTGLFAILTSGAGGGLLGGVLGIFKQKEETKTTEILARIELDRDKLDYENAHKERAHELVMLDKRAQLQLQGVKLEGDIELEKIESEGDIAIELANQNSLATAQSALNNLKTTTGMDNFRASVRPSLAYYYSILFAVMMSWAFYKFAHLITPLEGKELLLTMFSTLTFVVTSVVTFYYVSRPNRKK